MSEKSTRKEMVAQYMEMKTRYGIFQIKNNANGKIYIATAKNLRAKENSYGTFLENNNINKEICSDYKIYGKDNFEFSVLEEDTVPDDKFFDMTAELEKMLANWLEKLQPYGEKGYNKIKSK